MLWFSLNGILICVTFLIAVVPHDNQSSAGSTIIPVSGAQIVFAVALLQLMENIAILILTFAFTFLVGRHFNLFHIPSLFGSSTALNNGSQITRNYSGSVLSDRDNISNASLNVFSASSALASSASTSHQQKVVWRFVTLSSFVAIAVVGEVISCCIDLTRSRPSVVNHYCGIEDDTDLISQ